MNNMTLQETFGKLKMLVTADKLEDCLNIRTFDEINEECEEKVLEGFGFVLYTEYGMYDTNEYNFLFKDDIVEVIKKSDNDYTAMEFKILF